LEEHNEHGKHHEAHKPHPEHHPHKRKPAFAPVHVILAVLIGVVLLVNTVQILGINSAISGEAPPKPEIKVTLITADCEDCFDAKAVYDQLIGATEFEIEHDELPSTDAHSEKLMSTHKITRLPAIVVEGDVENVKLEGFTNSDDALVFQALAPYYDATSGSVKGKVSAIYLNADPAACKECGNLTALGKQLKSLGVAIDSEESVVSSSERGMQLINAYGITALPAVILSQDAAEYDIITQAWSQIGDIALDGSFVLRKPQPPYYDLAQKQVRGRLAMIGLTDATCAQCYNVSIHEQIFLSNFGAAFSSTTLHDISSAEGKKLLKQYGITQVPTVIITGDTAAYASIAQIWPQVGTVEEDGAHVFRSLDVLQGLTYKDLETGTVVTAGTATA